MQFRFLSAGLVICFATGWLPIIENAKAGQESMEYESSISIIHADQAGITLGDDGLIDRGIDDEITLNFEITYAFSDQFVAFLGGSFFNENETLKTSNLKSSESGFEREKTGIAYLWGEDTEFEIAIGRLEFSDERQWWWDAFLDSMRLQIEKDTVKFLLAHGRELGRSRSNLDFIDPEEEDIIRSLAQIEWEISDNHQLAGYYLKQDDQSTSYMIADSLNQRRFDEEDADLRWLGLNYRNRLSDESFGEIDFMLGYAHVSGKSTVYEISGTLINAIDQFDLEASAHELSINWEPVFNPDLKFIVSLAQGSGDNNLNDSKIETFRQTGLHGNEADFSYYGVLYQPEFSNIRIDSFGINYEGFDNFEISLMRHEYRQVELDTEMRDVSIDLDTNGIDRRLGREIDLIIKYQALDRLEFKFTGAEFEAGGAYDLYAGRKSHYWSIEMDYQF